MSMFYSLVKNNVALQRVVDEHGPTASVCTYA